MNVLNIHALIKKSGYLIVQFIEQECPNEHLHHLLGNLTQSCDGQTGGQMKFQTVYEATLQKNITHMLISVVYLVKDNVSFIVAWVQQFKANFLSAYNMSTFDTCMEQL